MNILVPNLGSTSLKFKILAMPDEKVLHQGTFERVSNYREAVAGIAAGDTPVHAVAFKAVHAGPRFRGTFPITVDVIAALEQFLPAAPVHNRIYLDAIAAFFEMMPGVPLVAAFETEFHASMPEYAKVYGVPEEWRSIHGVERLGFHGASHAYVAERTAQMLQRDAGDIRLISCHLGGSSSICAIHRGRSIDTTMGFSPQSGLENATRHGELDVFAVLYMMDRCGWSSEETRRQLAQVSGLAGLSGVAGGDVRDIVEASRKGSTEAALALDVFTYQVRKAIGAYAAAMGGLDAIAFTGGIGENSPALRDACCLGLAFLGVHMDRALNEDGQGDRIVSTGSSPVKLLAMATNEELVVARRAYRTLA